MTQNSEIHNDSNNQPVDPLDAYMLNLNEQLEDERRAKRKKLTGNSVITSNNLQNQNDKSKAILLSNDDYDDDVKNNYRNGAIYSIEDEHQEISSSILSFDNKRAKMKPVNHSKIYYPPFRKNFYVMPSELSKMTDQDIDILRLRLDGIRVRGAWCPPPATSWLQCGLNRTILNILSKNNYKEPTAIQSQAIPAMMSGKDILAIAKTGSGKTLAFVLPALRHIMDQRPVSPNSQDGPIVVVLTPTRELALQTTREFRKFSKFLHHQKNSSFSSISSSIRVSCVYGGTSISEQISELKKTPHLIVCTPGRLIDMLAANNGRVTNLRRCTLVIIDEADRMLDFGFEPQVKFLIENIRPDRQSVMFSATFPREMQSIAKLILNNPIEINVGKQKSVCEDVTLFAIVLEESQKFLKLLELLGQYIDKGSVLVFVEKQEKADSLTKDLIKYHYPSVALHGGIDQYDRDSIISDFRQGVMDLMVATSVAARGLDVSKIILVVNYDCPNHYEDFVHRCGRTGRAKNKGFAYTFLTEDDAEKSLDIIRAMAASKAQVPDQLRQLWKSYEEEMKSAGKKIRYRSSASGFSGRGFKFNDDEAQMVVDRKKFQKNILQIQDDSDDEVLDIDEQIEQIFAPKSRITSGESALLTSGNILIQNNLKKSKTLTTGESNEAKRIAEKIQQSKTKEDPLEANKELLDSSQKIASAIITSSGGVMPEITKKLLAKKFAEQIELKKGHAYDSINIINDSNSTNSLNPNDPSQNRYNTQSTKNVALYETELEINDFPQNVRFKITTKDTLDSIMDFANVFIAVRGVFCGQQKHLPDNERRLYLFLQSEHEINIKKAKSEIVRIIKEELLRLQNTYVPSSNRSRYKVI